MKGKDLFEYVERLAEKSNDAIRTLSTSESIGFSIPIPRDATQEAVKEVDKKLSDLRWSFKRGMIGHIEYYTLFPYGQ